VDRLYRRVGPLGLTARAVYALEQYAAAQPPPDAGWRPLFQMLWSFDRVGHSSYRDSLLLSLLPERVLDNPYTVEAWVEPPSCYCFTKEEVCRYLTPEWGLPRWREWLPRLEQNEFGYLHPEPGSRELLGITRDAYDRLRELYSRLPGPVLEQVENLLDALADFIQEILDGEEGAGLEQAVRALGLEPPPLEPFSMYKRGSLEDLGGEDTRTFFLGRPRPRRELPLPSIFI